MPINDQLDENAVDFRNTQPDVQSPQTIISAVDTGNSRHGVTGTQAILAIGIMLGIVTIVYLVLQNQTMSGQAPSSAPFVPIKSPPKKTNTAR